MTDDKNKPRHFQNLMAEAYRHGENLIVQAPTGAGKTQGALLPGVEAVWHSRRDQNYARAPQKIIFAVPMRVLAKSFVDEYADQADKNRWRIEDRPTVQTSTQASDPLFEGRIVFATVDQLLASFLNKPFGLPGRLGNINAGGIIGSYLIFDEFHLYPQGEMMLTVLAMLRMTQDVSRFTLMSATFSSQFLKQIAQTLNATAIFHDPDNPVFTDTPKQERTWVAENRDLNADAVLELSGQRTLVVCNTVDHAQGLYLYVRDALEQRGIKCTLLHSRFYPSDRQQHEDDVIAAFDTDNKQPVVVIATQVVEVGLDISADVLLTECATAASLIQRAGRCARREGNTGNIHVFRARDEDGEVSYVPYDETLAANTWEALASSRFNGQVLRFEDEQALIDIVHGEADQSFVHDLETRIEGRIGEITKCMRSPTYDVGSLIRENTDVPLYIHPDPNQSEQLTHRPYELEGFSVSKGRLHHMFQTMLEQDVEADWYLQGAQPVVQAVDDSYEDKANYKWIQLRESGDVYSEEYWNFAVHPLAVDYDPRIGLRFQNQSGKMAMSAPVKESQTRIFPPFRVDTYVEHIQGLYRAYSEVRERETVDHSPPVYYRLDHEIRYALHRLCAKMDKDPEHAEYLLRLVIALHDVGKLNRPWQEWAHTWQEMRHKQGKLSRLPHEMYSRHALAHTEFNRREEKTFEKQFYNTWPRMKRGNHSVESVRATLLILKEACRDDKQWFAITAGAIMHHHSPFAGDYGDFHLAAGAETALADAIQVCGFSREDANRWMQQIHKEFVHGDATGNIIRQNHLAINPTPQEYDIFLMYGLFVRILRLADQRSSWYVD